MEIILYEIQKTAFFSKMPCDIFCSSPLLPTASCLLQILIISLPDYTAAA